MRAATPTTALDRAAFFFLAAGLGLIQITIQGESLLGVAAVLWAIGLIRERRWPSAPAFFLPLLALAAWTLVSTLASPDPRLSLHEDKQLILYLAVPLVMGIARAERAETILNVIIAVGAADALIGVVQYAALGFDTLQARPHGLWGHYMTYSGVVMLVACVAVARLMFRDSAGWIWPAVAVPALVAALAFSSSRNTWIGALVAATVLVAIKNWRWLAVIPVLAVVAMALAPDAIRQRAWSALDPNDPTRRDRIAMLESGRMMIADHPWTGVGPNMVPKAYLEQYKTADAVDPPDRPGSTRAHLHNVPVQLAAERGLPALAAWLAFIALAARDLVRQVRRGPARSIAAAGIAVLVAAVVAGLFEHNFGDSEFLVLLLALLTLPFAAARALPHPAESRPAGSSTARHEEPLVRTP